MATAKPTATLPIAMLPSTADREQDRHHRKILHQQGSKRLRVRLGVPRPTAFRTSSCVHDGGVRYSARTTRHEV